jgi:drug/metabolite transporter (DMT)-like permease
MNAMTSARRTAILSLAASGVLWGLSVPLSKLALTWLTPAWLTVARFALAAPALAFVGRRGLRAAVTPGIVAAGAIGFGGVVLMQNSGVALTSVSHASVIIGVVPMLAALIAAGMRQARTGVLAWAGYGVALLGIALIAGHGGAGSSDLGDALVLASATVSALFIVLQPRLLDGQDAAAVTAVQFAAAALAALPFAVLHGGVSLTAAGHMPTEPLLALAALAVAGTLLPFWLFARGQVHVSASLAGAFVNLEPLVGAAVGWVAFGNAAGVPQFAGALAVLCGVALSALPESSTDRVEVSLRTGLARLRLAPEGRP